MISSIPNSGFGYISVGLDKLKTYLLSQMKYYLVQDLEVTKYSWE